MLECVGFVIVPASMMRMKRSLDMSDDEQEPFVADRPGLWFIKHKSSGLLLFLGRLIRPDPAIEDATNRDEL